MDIKFKTFNAINKAAACYGLSLRDKDLLGNRVESNTQLVYHGWILIGQLILGKDGYVLEAFKHISLLYSFGADVEKASGKSVTLDVQD